jgi:hypothetical protein
MFLLLVYNTHTHTHTQKYFAKEKKKENPNWKQKEIKSRVFFKIIIDWNSIIIIIVKDSQDQELQNGDPSLL